MSGSNKKKIYIFIFAFFCVLLLNSCGKKIEEVNNDYLKLTDYIITNEKEEKILLNKLNKNKLEKINEKVPFIDMDFKENVNVFNIKKDVGENLVNTKLEIDTEKEKISLEKEYNYRSFKLSPSGNYLAYTSFSSDDYSSANNIKIYDITNKKYIDLPDDILLSGDLFCWEKDDSIVFYGVEPGDDKSGKLYKYSIAEKETTIFYDKIDGYVTYFSIIDENNLLLLESDVAKITLSIAGIDGSSKVQVSHEIESITETKVSKDKTTIYFVSKLTEKKNVIYKLSIGTKSIKRITFDFPPNTEAVGSLHIEENNDLIIIGINNAGKNMLYRYEDKSNTISLVNSTEGQYKIFSP